MKLLQWLKRLLSKDFSYSTVSDTIVRLGTFIGRVYSISDNLRQRVIEEANYRCEYCKTSSRLTGTPLVMEHILPRSQGGSDDRSNLAASCYRCNEFKGVKTDTPDPKTGQLAPLFNPRTQEWRDHFAWINGGTHVVGVTPTGRATVIALRLNNENVVEARSLWIEFSWHPPVDKQ